MQKGAVKKQSRRKDPTGPLRRITTELPTIKCEKLNCKQLIFNWKIEGLKGTVQEQKEVLLQKIGEMNESERKRAAVCLLEVHADNTFVSASLLVIRELEVGINLGTVADKAFRGRSYAECVAILEKAGLSFDQKTMDMIKEFCDKKNGLPTELYQVGI